MVLSKSFAAAPEDLWMIFGSDTLDESMFLCKSKIPQTKRAFSEQVFKPCNFREVDLSDFTRDIPRTLRLGGFLTPLSPGTVCLGPLPV